MQLRTLKTWFLNQIMMTRLTFCHYFFWNVFTTTNVLYHSRWLRARHVTIKFNEFCASRLTVVDSMSVSPSRKCNDLSSWNPHEEILCSTLWLVRDDLRVSCSLSAFEILCFFFDYFSYSKLFHVHSVRLSNLTLILYWFKFVAYRWHEHDS